MRQKSPTSSGGFLSFERVGWTFLCQILTLEVYLEAVHIQRYVRLCLTHCLHNVNQNLGRGKTEKKEKELFLMDAEC